MTAARVLAPPPSGPRRVVPAATLPRARSAGVAWAERETPADGTPPSGPWPHDPRDALLLVHHPNARERGELARACNAAAAERWAELCVAPWRELAEEALAELGTALEAVGFLQAVGTARRLGELPSPAPVDTRAERIVLAGLLGRVVGLEDLADLRVDDFGPGLHRALAATLIEGAEPGPAFGAPEARSYLRGLARLAERLKPQHCVEGSLRVLALARQRSAVDVLEPAVRALRNDGRDGCDQGAIANALRRALAALEGGP